MPLKIIKTFIVILLLSVIFSHTLFAGEIKDQEKFLQEYLSIQKLLDMEITVASRGKGLTLRESPGIVTLITAEEIANSGTRLRGRIGVDLVTAPITRIVRHREEVI